MRSASESPNATGASWATASRARGAGAGNFPPRFFPRGRLPRLPAAQAEGPAERPPANPARTVRRDNPRPTRARARRTAGRPRPFLLRWGPPLRAPGAGSMGCVPEPDIRALARGAASGNETRSHLSKAWTPSYSRSVQSAESSCAARRARRFGHRPSGDATRREGAAGTAARCARRGGTQGPAPPNDLRRAGAGHRAPTSAPFPPRADAPPSTLGRAGGRRVRPSRLSSVAMHGL